MTGERLTRGWGYPRTRGEHQMGNLARRGAEGPSPHAWGTRRDICEAGEEIGTIPARAVSD